MKKMYVHIERIDIYEIRGGSIDKASVEASCEDAACTPVSPGGDPEVDPGTAGGTTCPIRPRDPQEERDVWNTLLSLRVLTDG